MISSRREFLATSGASLTTAAMPGDKSIRTKGGTESGRWLYYIDGHSSCQPISVSVFSVGGPGGKTVDVIDCGNHADVECFVPDIWFEPSAADEGVCYFKGMLVGIGDGLSNSLNFVGDPFYRAFEEAIGSNWQYWGPEKSRHLAVLTTTMLYPEEWLSSLLTASACRRAGAFVLVWVVSPSHDEIDDMDEYQACLNSLKAAADICVVSPAHEIDSAFGLNEHDVRTDLGRAEFLGGMVNRVVWDLRKRKALGLHSPDLLGLPRWPELFKEKADRVAEQLLAILSTQVQ
jgi:hypothetical protein